MTAMGRLNLFAFLLILSSLTGNHATLVAEQYWNSVLPNTPMPKAVRDHLRPRRNQISEQATAIPSITHAEGKQLGGGSAGKPIPAIISLDVARRFAVDAAAEANPAVVLLQAHRQVTVDAAAEANPGILVSGAEQVTVDGEGGMALALIAYSSNEEAHKKKSGGAAAADSAKQVTVDVAAEANPGILVSGAKQVTVDRESGMALALIFYSSNEEAHKKKSGGAAAAADSASVVDTRVKQELPAALHSNGDEVGRIDRPNAHSFFLEKDLRRGAKLSFWANRAFSADYFLPRRVAESIPFSSSKLPEVMRSFSVRPDSLLMVRMKETLRMCETPVPDVEKKRCATSLESMVDFATSVLGTRDIVTVSTAAKGRVPGQLYTVESWSAVPTAGERTVACHAVAYPYTVFHCHMTPASNPYMVRLVGADGAEVEAAAMCHRDTSAWDPFINTLVAFNEKPGGAAVCHLLPEGDLLWFARVGGAASV